MNFCTLASGSNGNAVYINDGDAHLLVDVGVSMRELKRRLAELSVTTAQLCGLLITHAHGDHVRGLELFARETRVPIYGNRETLLSVIARNPDLPPARLSVFEGEGPYSIGGFTVTPFPVQHDEPCVGYRIAGRSKTLGIATDIGCLTDALEQGLQGVNFALIEANHDVEMLQNGIYPAVLKRRVLSPYGHLSNDECGNLAQRLLQSGCHHFLLGHLSENNNLPRLAADTVCGALASMGARPGEVTVDVAPRKSPSPIFSF